jgi:hypothetical protein
MIFSSVLWFTTWNESAQGIQDATEKSKTLNKAW